MWEPLQNLQFDDSLIAYQRPNPKPLPELKPELEEEEEEEEVDEFFEWAEEQRHERRLELGQKCMEEYHKRKARERSKLAIPKRPMRYSEDARERMDQRKYNRAVEREFTLTPRQAQILTAYSKGLRLKFIAMKYKICVSMVAAHLVNARYRLFAKTNTEAARIALKKGLIK